MRIRTKKYLKEKFREYYQNPEIKHPPRQTKREWGFIHYTDRYPEEINMKRHMAFQSKKTLEEYLGSMAPAHTYYSSAYYENPNATTMDGKNWLGADLIFDLDADYITQGKSYRETLHEVKKEADKLINEFLIPDLGIDKKELQLVFSGGRGYHIHIQNELVKELGSTERREVIDYISGKGIQPIKQHSQKKEEEIHEYMKFRKTKNSWDSKIKDYIYRELPREIQSTTKEEAIKKLSKLDKVGEKKAMRLYKFFNDPERIERAKKTDNLNMIRGVKKDIWQQLTEKAIEKNRVNADEPVTSDIKRLIRLPGSLHGGTGLQVKPINIDKIDQFSPLDDAVVFKDSPVKIKPKQDIQIEIKNRVVTAEKNTLTEIPEYAAVLLAAKNKIEVEGW
ncbi:DNA primase catalytic subunit PriS [Methanonatronarchaeum sp. AMET6-2]|uniref:DNA primase catalytic subunit PriS n=1 Tax=Methanonatronarchaeum sp. AMET6-2 TaxID=2933293 RepID=UPI001214543D|nr:DNA primase catalytic subunit PriS [Methanonatronarchaeum sp. AMET6-2]RZN62599.1 MAG: DNA primase catalytic subunit PriS [Methanonatronarchaeia archaeon]UOY09407.1 DNA primase catalytic subunit PriS [Methanonatronarchaeum sp. AMET6-2]